VQTTRLERVSDETNVALIGLAEGVQLRLPEMWNCRIGTCPNATLKSNPTYIDDDLIVMKVDPLLKSLHNDPRFAAFLKKLNLSN
jgi:hypothetical protein